MKYCKRCLTPDTRPRIIFKDDICNACLWHEKKKKIDWRDKWRQLEAICGQFRRKNTWDVVIPCSGGKDGSYVAWKFKYELGMHPLCVTFTPPIPTQLGEKNLQNFINSGFDVVKICPNPKDYRRLCKKLFIEKAMSKFPFVIGIGTAVSYFAKKFNIDFIVYGEEGETEYGGTDKYENKIWMDYKYYTDIYHEGIYLKESWWKRLPEIEQNRLKITWWSKFENWDDKKHADLAKEKCGLETCTQKCTFTDYAQLDDYLQDLHMFECFIKFGFGRATADVNLAIKGGRMTREEGIKIVQEKDGMFPLQYLENYLNFFEMTENEFWQIIDKHANKEILKETGDMNRPYILKCNQFGNQN